MIHLIICNSRADVSAFSVKKACDILVEPRIAKTADNGTTPRQRIGRHHFRKSAASGKNKSLWLSA
jgi:hypothetical protein